MRRAALVVALLAPATASSYVLSTWGVVKLAAEHRSNLQVSTLVVKATLSFRGEESKAAAAAVGVPDTGALTLPGSIFFKMPGKCRIELEGRGKDVPSASNVDGVRTAGSPPPVLPLYAAQVCPLLDGRTKEGLLAHVKSLGFDTNKTSLGRVGTTLTYVLGLNPREQGASLWYDKDTFEPVKIVAKEGAGLVELRLLDYGSAVSGEWHPRVIEIRRGSSPDWVARIQVEKIEPNGKIPDAIF